MRECESTTEKARKEGHISKLERYVNAARHFNLMSDVFMSVALKDIEACQYVLRVLTENENLFIKDVRTQYQIPSVSSHDVRLDVLAEDHGWSLYHIEIQRKNTVDHARRIRLYASMIDSNFLRKGTSYDQMPEVYIIYISETDIWKKGRLTYPIEKRLKNTTALYEDGLHILYINTAINDGSPIAELMQYFKKTDPDDMRFGALSKRIHYLKKEEGGYVEMCEISEMIFNEGKNEGHNEGRAEKAKETAFVLQERGLPIEEIANILRESIQQVQDWLLPVDSMTDIRK